MAFIKREEDFTCEHCGAAIRGNGYTNHCHRCLWSKHVDEQPGDRAADCGGLMRPIDYRAIAGGYDVLHRCESCHQEKWNEVGKDDNMEILIN